MPPAAPIRTNAERGAPVRVIALAVLAGAGLGATYGTALRAWMRFISDNPEFSWNGTLFIVGAFTITGALAGLVVGGRRRGWKALMVPARTVAIVLSLSCFGAAGAVMLPTIVLGALALGRTDWPRRVRGTLSVLSAASTLMVLADLRRLGLPHGVVAGAAYGALVLIEIRIFSEPYRATVHRLPATCKVLAAAVAVAAMLGVTAMTVGVVTARG